MLILHKLITQWTLIFGMVLFHKIDLNIDEL